jgi:hypothetical protein
MKLNWDLGNPMGKIAGIDLNKNEVTFDIKPHVLIHGLMRRRLLPLLYR